MRDLLGGTVVDQADDRSPLTIPTCLDCGWPVDSQGHEATCEAA